MTKQANKRQSFLRKWIEFLTINNHNTALLMAYSHSFTTSSRHIHFQFQNVNLRQRFDFSNLSSTKNYRSKGERELEPSVYFQTLKFNVFPSYQTRQLLPYKYRNIFYHETHQKLDLENLQHRTFNETENRTYLSSW